MPPTFRAFGFSLVILVAIVQLAKADDHTDVVLHLQAVLKERGLYEGEVDGECGPKTITGVLKYHEEFFGKDYPQFPCSDIILYYAPIAIKEGDQAAISLGMLVLREDDYDAARLECGDKVRSITYKGPIIASSVRELMRRTVSDIHAGSSVLKKTDGAQCLLEFFSQIKFQKAEEECGAIYC